MTRSSPSPVEAVADRLHSAAIHLLRRLRAQDDVLGVSAPRLSALSVVVFAGPLPIGELASTERVRAPTMTRLVDGLEHHGLVRRIPDPADGRGVLVRATPKGARMLDRGRARRVRALSESLRALSPAELAVLGRAADLIERVARDRSSIG